MAGFGVQEQNFEASTCTVATCTYGDVRADPGEAYTQAAGHPPEGITTFEFNHHSSLLGEEPEGSVRNIRVDLPPGLARTRGCAGLLAGGVPEQLLCT